MIWAQFCESCHGPDEAGVKAITERNPDRLENIIRGGVGNMSGLGYSDLTISPENMTRLLAYIANPGAGAGEFPAPVSRGGQAASGPLPTARLTASMASLETGGWPATACLRSGLRGRNWSPTTLTRARSSGGFPTGTAPGLAAKGIRNTGAFRVVRNGPVVTAGGLIFMGRSRTGPSGPTTRTPARFSGRRNWNPILRASRPCMRWADANTSPSSAARGGKSTM